MYDVAVIGCGIIGAAVAYELAKYNVSVVVLEAENDVSTGTTKANSAIIHAGYDPKPHTLMARLNVLGSKLTESICKKLDIPYKQIGSLVLAFSEDECVTLQKLCEQGVQNGVSKMRILNKSEVAQLEPNISPQVLAALYAPSAAIISPWEFALALAQTAVINGVKLHLNARVIDIEKKDHSYKITAKNSNGLSTYEAAYVVNAAGIYSDQIHNFVAPKEFTVKPNRGEYYLLDKSEGKRVNHIIFQCPNQKGKGVLVAPTVHGNLIVGPNSEAIENHDVSVTAEGLRFVLNAALKSVPQIQFKESIRNFAGLRSHTEYGDFIIRQAQENPHWIDAAGIKSPGLSAAPAIALEVTELLQKAGLSADKKSVFINERKKIRFAELSIKEKTALVKKNPAYGRVICRCETVTEGEIIDAFNAPIPPDSIDAVKRRVGAGMGRCQGGFCSPRVLELLVQKRNLNPLNIVQDKEGSTILTDETKKANSEVCYV